MTFHSADGIWTVQGISLDGRELLRVTTTDPAKAPIHADGKHRMGLVRMASGYWVADVAKPVDVEMFVPLSELREAA